ncbi:kinase-like domain-containing protein [Mycena vulgaris]|nr:kinase-like domain-containing protein [Mycena vulgaris]
MPQANVVITHDDDWRDILLDDGKQNTEEIPPDFLQLIFNHFEITEEDGAAYLTKSEATREPNPSSSLLLPPDVTALSDPSNTTQSEGTSTPVPLDEITPESPPETRLFPSSLTPLLSSPRSPVLPQSLSSPLTPFWPQSPSLPLTRLWPLTTLSPLTPLDKSDPADASGPSPYSFASPPPTKQTSTSAAELSPQENTLIYKNLLSLFHDVNSERNLGLDSTLAQYYATMCAGDEITSLIRSSEYRKTLLEFASRISLTDDRKFQDALQKDDTRFLATLPVVIHSRRELSEQLTIDDAQDLLDVLKIILQTDLSQKHRSEAWKMMLRISSTHDQLPASMFITGVTNLDRKPKFGGGFSNIYRASYDGKPVALKRLRLYAGLSPSTARLKFYREALLWHNLHNPFILPLIGVDREMFSSELCFVSPWMELGTILSYLRENGRTGLAQGIQYLHSQNIVHGDPRGNNILITSELTACVGDFGLSSFSDNSEDSTQQAGLTLSESSEWESSTQQGGSLRWMAPELFTIYNAFGCLCVELYTGRIPFSNVSSEAAVMLSVLSGKRPERPTGQAAMSDALWDLVIACWAHDPPSRPSMQTVVENTTAFAGEPESKQAELAPEYGVRKPKKSKELKNITQPGGKRGRASIGKSLA